MRSPAVELDLADGFDLRTVQPLLVAVLASSGPHDHSIAVMQGNAPKAKVDGEEEEEEEEEPARTIRRAAVNTRVADLLPAFDYFRNGDGDGFWFRPELRARQAEEAAAAEFIALHLGYQRRIRLLRSDEHWKRARLGALLIDWELLGLHVAMLKKADLVKRATSDATVGTLAAFLHDTARALRDVRRPY